ncbi:response regulator transcription factor [Granulosicoccus sp.]|nr:response regulator transcription factor [Granulosicoccus sp.]MDB4223688.1 response regulator transcription factor [Granulosicoccus sp.]
MSDLPEIPQHIMVVEDDESLARWIADYLETHNFQVTVATRGDAALELIRNDSPDAVILDLNLPVMDGLEVCRQARLFFDNPIIMLTARDTDSDEIEGLDKGADDYLAKPVKPSILLARLRALLRRSQKATMEPTIFIGGLHIDTHSRTVMLFDNVIALSSHEYDVLHVLATNVGQAMSRESLVERIRGIEYDGFDRSVDICISRLRRKLLDDAQVPRRIKTLRGVGYMLTADAW